MNGGRNGSSEGKCGKKRQERIIERNTLRGVLFELLGPHFNKWS